LQFKLFSCGAMLQALLASCLAHVGNCSYLRTVEQLLEVQKRLVRTGVECTCRDKLRRQLLEAERTWARYQCRRRTHCDILGTYREESSTWGW